MLSILPCRVRLSHPPSPLSLPSQYLTRSVWTRLVVPLGFFVGIHYACDNLSLTYLSVSAYTILSSSNTM